MNQNVGGVIFGYEKRVLRRFPVEVNQLEAPSQGVALRLTAVP